VVSAPLRRVWTRSTVALGSHPRAYLPLARWRYPENLVFGPYTEIVIEGFPRSANTYALAAFTCANGPRTVVASHLHAASSVAQGVRRGLPVIVVLRDPLDACASLLQRQPVQASSALGAYVRFHERVRPLVERS